MNTYARRKEEPAMDPCSHLSLAKGKREAKEQLVGEYEKMRLELESMAQHEYKRKGHMASGMLVDKSKELDEIGNQIMGSRATD